MKTKILLILIALSITSVQYHEIRFAVLNGPHLEYKIDSFLSMSSGKDCFKEHQKYFWRARYFSCLHSGLFARMNGLIHDYKQHIRFANVIAADQCVWLLMALVAIIILARKPLLFILGMGAALQYAWLPMSEGQINPWDMPTLFWWTLVLLVNETKYRKAILFLIPAGALYKEIIAILSILILFWYDQPIKRRLIQFGVIGSLCVAIKMFQGYLGGCSILGNQSFHYETKCRTGEYWIIHRNFNQAFRWNNFNPIWFANAGTWIGIFLLPMHRKFKIIAATYFCTVFVPGNITEARLWQELIPVFFVGYELIIRDKNERHNKLHI